MVCRRRQLSLATLLCVAAGGVVGCESPMHTENVALHQQNRELQDKLDAANAQLREAPDPAQYRQLQAELADRDRQLTDLRNQPPPTPVATEPAVVPAAPLPRSTFGDLETRVDPRAGTVTVTLPGDVLFPPGQADLRPAARVGLDKLVAALKRSYPTRPLRVEGHTDADPIVRSRADWDDNLDLSLSRAAAVTRYLVAHGIASKRITTSGYGSTHPRGTDKARNRRVEVVVVTR